MDSNGYYKRFHHHRTQSETIPVNGLPFRRLLKKALDVLHARTIRRQTPHSVLNDLPNLVGVSEGSCASRMSISAPVSLASSIWGPSISSNGVSPSLATCHTVRPYEYRSIVLLPFHFVTRDRNTRGRERRCASRVPSSLNGDVGRAIPKVGESTGQMYSFAMSSSFMMRTFAALRSP